MSSVAQSRPDGIVTRAVLPLRPRSIAAGSALANDRVAQDTDLRHLHLDDVAVLHVLGGTVGAHPQDVPGVERQVLANPADELADAEDRILDGVREHLLAVEPDGHVQVVRVESGNDPRPHRLERVGILAAPEGPVVALPRALADI